MLKDQFGNVVTEEQARVLLARARRGVGRKRGADPEPNGYAGIAGTGPKGETCKTCRHLYRNQRSQKTYLKCELFRPFWTGGRKTDVLAKSPACNHWEGA